METYKIALSAGDGIGEELILQSRKILKALEQHFGVSFELIDILSCGPAIDVYGTALRDEDIDASDVTVINNAVTAGATVSDAPMCDADHSGTIDATDATFVQSLIDGTATFCYYYNVDGAICKFTFHDKINAIALHRCVVRSATVLDNFDFEIC